MFYFDNNGIRIIDKDQGTKEGNKTVDFWSCLGKFLTSASGQLKDMSELPDVAEKVVGIVGELEDSFMKEIPKQIVDGFKSV